MSDYPMLISNKLHSFRNFMLQRYWFLADSARRLVFLWRFVWCFCGILFGVFVAIRLVFLRSSLFRVSRCGSASSS